MTPGTRRLDDWITSYMEFTDESESPLVFRKWTAISAVAAALQRRVYYPWIGPDITLFPNMYIVLIGPSGVRKSSAIIPAKKLLREAKIPIGPDWTTKEALVQSFLDQRAGEMAAIGEGPIVGSHHSLTIISSELQVFMKERNTDLHAVLCDLYDADSLRYKTKKDGDQFLENVWLNLLGATTPTGLRSMFPVDSMDYGLTSRMNFIYAAKKHKIVISYKPTKEDIQKREDLLFDLKQLRQLAGPVQLTEGWLQRYTDWVYEEEGKPPVTLDPRFGGYQERRQGHLIKLSMILQASQGNKLLLLPETFTQAKKLLLESERGMHRAFAGQGKLEDSQIIHRVWETILGSRDLWFSELLKQFIYDIDEARLMILVRSLQKISKGMMTLERDVQRNDYRIRLSSQKESEDEQPEEGSAD